MLHGPLSLPKRVPKNNFLTIENRNFWSIGGNIHRIKMQICTGTGAEEAMF